MALYTIDRINRLRANLGVSPETPYIGGHAECDKIDAILGIDTTGGHSRRRHWRGTPTPANPVGVRVVMLEMKLCRHNSHNLRSSAKAPCGSPVTSYFWLGAEGSYL